MGVYITSYVKLIAYARRPVSANARAARTRMEYAQLVGKSKAKSKVWTHFGFPADGNGTFINQKKVICRLCKSTVAYSGNTSNLSYHLQREHPREHRELMAEHGHGNSDKKAESSRDASHATKTKQLTLGGAIAKAAPYPRDSNKHKQLVEATADFVCHSLQPLSVVDEPSFRRLLEIAEPRFQLPHRTHFTEKVIPNKYREVRAIVEKQLGAVQNCAMTTDLWTSQHQHRSYISLTVHFVDSGFKTQSRCLQTLEVPQDHDASSLKDVLASLFQSWKITEKVCGATTDNGRNIVNAVGLLGIEHFPCVAHTLQLSIKNGLEVTRVQRVLGRCRKLVEHFRKSTKETFKLREKQEMLKLPQHQLTQECTTRWGSTLGMLQRIMEQQAAIAAVLIEGKVRHLMPEGNDWMVIELLVDILKPFQHATEVMSAVKYPTVSMVKPLLYKLLEKTLKVTDSDATTAREVKKAIRNDLQE